MSLNPRKKMRCYLSLSNVKPSSGMRLKPNGLRLVDVCRGREAHLTTLVRVRKLCRDRVGQRSTSMKRCRQTTLTTGLFTILAPAWQANLQ